MTTWCQEIGAGYGRPHVAVRRRLFSNPSPYTQLWVHRPITTKIGEMKPSSMLRSEKESRSVALQPSRPCEQRSCLFCLSLPQSASKDIETTIEEITSNAENSWTLWLSPFTVVQKIPYNHLKQ